MLKMIADHMENGFLENITDMFKHDPSLYEHIPGLMMDERSRVRIGTAALIETLLEEHRERMNALPPRLAGLLKHENPAVRADTAYVLGIVGGHDALKLLQGALDDPVVPVRHVIEETIAELTEAADD